MNKPKILFVSIMLILSSLIFILLLIQAISMTSKDIILSSRLPKNYHFTIINIVWPVVGSIIFAVIFPRLLSPLFLKIKKKISKKYENGFLDLKIEPLAIQIYLKRAILVTFLTFGLIAMISGSINLSSVVLTEVESQKFQKSNFPIHYSLSAFISLMGLFFPLSIGIWSIDWSFHDAGLIHYNLPKNVNDKFFEIQPIHRSYDALIKGYAGITSIIFFIALLIFYIVNYPESIFNVVMILFFGFLPIIMSFPAYFAYCKTNIKFLRKNIPEIRRITEIETINMN